MTTKKTSKRPVTLRQVTPVVHSPGPFTIAGGGYLSIRDADGFEIARVGCWNEKRQPDDSTCEANATLFKSAPKLLDALGQALLWIEVDETTHGRKFGAGNVAREAIAEATGVEVETESEDE